LPCPPLGTGDLQERGPHYQEIGGSIKYPTLEWTKQIWQPYAKDALPDEDVRQIIKDMTGFVKILKEWKEKENDRTSSSGK